MEQLFEIQIEFSQNIISVINKFNEEHPDLYIGKIEIINQETVSGRKIFAGIRADIIIQRAES